MKKTKTEFEGKIILKVHKERACLEDECDFCERPFKPNNTMYVADESITWISLCKECFEKFKPK